MSVDPNNLGGTAYLTFDDEFNTLNIWNGSSGVWSTTFWYQDPNGPGSTINAAQEQEWYINANYAPTSGIQPWAANGGVLTLTATPTNSYIQSLIGGYAYTSGELNTYHSFAQTYGYFEIRAQMPADQGFWPAFWLMPESGQSLPELDVAELLGSYPTILTNSAHSSISGMQDNFAAVSDTTAGFHTYGMDWEPDFITWYFDGQPVYQIATPADMNQPMYMIVNLAVGGSFGGSPDWVSSGQMQVDYIRAYQADSLGYSGAPSSPSEPAAPASSPAPTPSAGGETFNSDNNGDLWYGTSGNDTFNLGRGGDWVAGDGGADTFAFAGIPWAPAHIMDFHSGDVIDLSGMFASVNYGGSDPVADGRLWLGPDGQGGTQVWFDADGLTNASGSWQLLDLPQVNPSSLYVSGAFIGEYAW